MRFGPPAWDLQTVTAATGANSWGFFLKASSLTCERYNDAAYLASQRGTISYGGGDTLEGPVTLIPIDSEGLVGDGSFCFKAGSGSVATSIFVWDVLGADLYEHTLTAGDRATTPVYVGGYLYWLEWQITFVNPCTVSLMRSRCDLGDVTELETFSLPEVNGNAGGAVVDWIFTIGTALAFCWRTANEDLTNHARVYSKQHAAGSATDESSTWSTRFGWSESGTPTWYDAKFDCPGASIYEPSSSKAWLAVLTDPAWSGEQGILSSSTAVTGATSIWNAAPSGDWALGIYLRAVSIYSTDAQVYGSTDGTPYLIRHPRESVPGGAPVLRVEPEGDGDLQYPSALFYVGPSA